MRHVQSHRSPLLFSSLGFAQDERGAEILELVFALPLLALLVFGGIWLMCYAVSVQSLSSVADAAALSVDYQELVDCGSDEARGEYIEELILEQSPVFMGSGSLSVDDVSWYPSSPEEDTRAVGQSSEGKEIEVTSGYVDLSFTASIKPLFSKDRLSKTVVKEISAGAVRLDVK